MLRVIRSRVDKNLGRAWGIDWLRGRFRFYFELRALEPELNIFRFR